MKRHWGIRAADPLLPVLLPVLAAVVVASGCSSATRHRILSTVFDGVPPPDTTAAAVPVVPPDSAVARDDERRPPPGPPSLVVHPPFEEKRCDVCHELEGQGRFTGKASLLAPERELCVSCHEEMAFDSLRERYGWIHGPVAAGACTGCHSPHRSAHEKLLLTTAGGELCLRCHDPGRLTSTETHEDVETECFECHAAHGEVDPW